MTVYRACRGTGKFCRQNISHGATKSGATKSKAGRVPRTVEAKKRGKRGSHVELGVTVRLTYSASAEKTSGEKSCSGVHTRSHDQGMITSHWPQTTISESYQTRTSS